VSEFDFMASGKSGYVPGSQERESLEATLENLPGVRKGTMRVSGTFGAERLRQEYPDVFWRPDTPELASMVRIGDVLQIGPDAPLVADWRPGDGPLAVQPYKVVEQVEPGVWRLSWAGDDR
jgi:hypothetical protein